jgi:hypothetical protein
MLCIGITIKTFMRICKRFHSKIHLYEKVTFGQKDVQLSLSTVSR